MSKTRKKRPLEKFGQNWIQIGREIGNSLNKEWPCKATRKAVVRLVAVVEAVQNGQCFPFSPSGHPLPTLRLWPWDPLTVILEGFYNARVGKWMFYRLRRCSLCDRWYFAVRLRRQKWCSPKCRKKYHSSTEAFKAHRREYMRKHYRRFLSTEAARRGLRH